MNSNLEIQQPEEEDSSNKKESVESQFQRERLEYKQFIDEIAGTFKGPIENMSETQVKIFSKRQLAVEYTYSLIAKHASVKKKYQQAWKKEYDKLGDSEYRYGEKEKLKLVESQTAGYSYLLSLIQSHIDYIRETTKTIDNMVFGVKHRIDIEDFKRGNR